MSEHRIMSDLSDQARPSSASVLWLASAGHFLNDSYGNVYPTLVPLVAASMGFGLVSGSLVITGAGVVSSLLQPLFGAIADRRSAAVLAPAALAVVAVATGMLGFAHATLLFLALAAIAGVANGAYHPPSLSLVRGVSGTRPGRHAAVFFTGGAAGRAVGPAMLVGFAALTGVRGLALLMPAGIVLALALATVARRHSPGRTGVRAGGGNATPSPCTASMVRQRLWPIFLVVSIAATRGVVTTSISTFWPLLHAHSVAALFGSSVVIAVMLLTGSIGNIVAGTASDRVPHHLLLAVTTVAAALSLGAFALSSGIWVYVFAALSGLFGMSGFAITTVMGQNLMPERVATASGLALGVANGLTSGLVALLALAAAAWGGPTALLLAAALSLCALPVTFAYPGALRDVRRLVALDEPARALASRPGTASGS